MNVGQLFHQWASIGNSPFPGARGGMGGPFEAPHFK